VKTVGVAFEPMESEVNMRLTKHYVHEYDGWVGPGGECVIRIYEAKDKTPVFICSGIRTNLNTSISNICEILALEVVERYAPHLIPRHLLAGRRALIQPPFLWFIHYPARFKSVNDRERAARGEYVLPSLREWIWEVTFASYRPWVIPGAPAQGVKLPDGTEIQVGDAASGRRSLGQTIDRKVTREYVEKLTDHKGGF
jgi:hypothetical protein